MEKIKVAHILPDFGIAGAEKLVTELLLNYDKSKFDIIAISLYEDNKSYFINELKENGCKIIFLNKKPGIDFSIIKKLHSTLKKEKVKIIHTHRYVVPYVILPSIICGIKGKIHTVHNIASKELTSKGIIIQNIAYKFLGFKPIGISSIISETIKKVYNIKDVKTIYNGIDTKKFLESKRINRESVVNILHIGRFSEQKNHKLLIEAFKIVSNKNKDLILNLVGEGPLKNDIIDLVNKYNLDNNVNFLGIREDIPRLMKENDIFILPSLWEGLPITLLEAMSSGIPMVASNVGGNSDIITNLENGILFESNNLNELVESINLLCKDKRLRDKFSSKSIEKSKSYDIRETSELYENLYSELIE